MQKEIKINEPAYPKNETCSGTGMVNLKMEKKTNMLEHIANFKKMPAWSQAEILEKEGTVLAQRFHKDWEVKLYSLHNHYVELWAKPEIKVTTTFHRSAKAIAVMEPYMDNIEVQDDLFY